MWWSLEYGVRWIRRTPSDDDDGDGGNGTDFGSLSVRSDAGKMFDLCMINEMEATDCLQSNVC